MRVEGCVWEELGGRGRNIHVLHGSPISGASSGPAPRRSSWVTPSEKRLRLSYLSFLPGPPSSVPKRPTGVRVLPRVFCEQHISMKWIQGLTESINPASNESFSSYPRKKTSSPIAQ